MKNQFQWRLRVFVVALCVAVFTVAPDLALAQELAVGKELAASVKPEEKHAYTFESGKNFYVYGFANQLTVDVVVRVLDPKGDVIAQFDSPDRGPEAFQFSPKQDGVYTVEISPFEGAEGDYKILLVANEPKKKDPKKLVDQMMAPFSGTDRPGASISVLKGGKVVFAKGYGMANLTDGVPMTQNTGMSIASISKQFTAMAILLLQNEGKLSLDDDVRKHMPELKDFGTPVTLRNMLNHTTGYREILNFLAMAGWNSTDAMTRDVPIRIIQRQANLQNAPGAEYNYNNTTFMLLATVVERVSGRDFREFMEERIFRPLKMNNTTIKTQQGQVIPNSSQGYTGAKGGGFNYVTDFASAYGASGVNATALDMTKWMLNYRDATVGGRDAIDLLTTRGILTGGDTTGYALGLGVRQWRGQTLYSHTGGETSHRSFFGYLPEIDAGLFLSGTNPSFSSGMALEIAAAFFSEYLEPEKEQPEELEDDGDHTTPTPAQLDAIAGTWSFIGAPLLIDYTVENGELFAQATGQPKFPVRPTSDSTFSFVGVQASVTFYYEKDGSVKRAMHHQGGNNPMEKVENNLLTEDELLVFTGRYFNDELETIYTVKLEDGKLKAYHWRNEPFGLTHRKKDEFSGGAWFLSSIKFDRDPTGAVDGFMGSNSRTRDVWFSKMR